MTGPLEPTRERALELLADRALFGLSAEDQAELERLLAHVPIADQESLEFLAADLTRAHLPETLEPLPSHLSRLILADAPGALPASKPPLESPRIPRRRMLARVLAAAAGLLLAFGLWRITRPRPLAIPTAAERRDALIARLGQPGSDVIRLDWTATADPSAQGASGDVVWSTRAQEGYMRFRGLATNVPTREQYQLWVFDAVRDERYPVDGGVFDVPAGVRDVVVPIRIKLGVTRPTLFAVTVEPPGGVVVSTRERLPLLAKVLPIKAG